jgi:hypothetical protein
MLAVEPPEGVLLPRVATPIKSGSVRGFGSVHFALLLTLYKARPGRSLCPLSRHKACFRRGSRLR